MGPLPSWSPSSLLMSSDACGASLPVVQLSSVAHPSADVLLAGETSRLLLEYDEILRESCGKERAFSQVELSPSKLSPVQPSFGE